MPSRTDRTPPKPQPPAVPAVDPRSSDSFVDDTKARARQRSQDIAENGPAPARDPTLGAPRVEYPAEEAGDGACEEDRDFDLSPFIIAITQIVKNGIKNYIDDNTITSISNMIQHGLEVFNPLLIGGAIPVNGTSIINDLDPNLIAKVTKGIQEIGEAVPYIGAIVDFTVQIMEGEDIEDAILKTGGHLGLSALIQGGVTLLFGAAVAASPMVIVATALIVAGADYLYDKYAEEPIDNLINILLT